MGIIETATFLGFIAGGAVAAYLKRDHVPYVMRWAHIGKLLIAGAFFSYFIAPFLPTTLTVISVVGYSVVDIFVDWLGRTALRQQVRREPTSRAVLSVIREEVR